MRSRRAEHGIVWANLHALPPAGHGLKRWVTIVGLVVVILPVAFMTVGIARS